MRKSKADIRFAPFLYVPVECREEAKALGARWNADARRWFIPKGMDHSPFAAWIPEVSSSARLRARCPFYVAQSSETCWKCGKLAEVVTFASHGVESISRSPIDPAIPADDADDAIEEAIDDFVIYSYVEYLPARLALFMRDRYPGYYIDYSKTTSSYYWMNHCACVAPLGDFFMHSEPEGAFFPINKRQASSITLWSLKSSGYLSLDACYGTGPDALVARFAKRKTIER